MITIVLNHFKRQRKSHYEYQGISYRNKISYRLDNKLKNLIQGTEISVTWMRHTNKDRWFAVPFILDITDNDYIVWVEKWYIFPIRQLPF